MSIFMTITCKTMFPTIGEPIETDIEIEVTGSYCSADPSVGIMSGYFEDICATNIETKEPVELTANEEERAQEKLSEAMQEAYYEYYD